MQDLINDFLNSKYVLLPIGVIGILLGINIIKSGLKLQKKYPNADNSHAGKEMTWVRGIGCIFLGLIALYNFFKLLQAKKLNTEL